MQSLPVENRLNFMKHLLAADDFDSFLLVHGTITTSNIYDVDGRVVKEFFGNDLDASPLYGYEYTPWAMMKDWAYGLIRGHRTPVAFKFVMHAGEELKKEILSQSSAEARNSISDLVLTIKFDSSGMSVISATSSAAFTMDRTADELWDSRIASFIRDMQ